MDRGGFTRGLRARRVRRLRVAASAGCDPRECGGIHEDIRRAGAETDPATLTPVEKGQDEHVHSGGDEGDAGGDDSPKGDTPNARIRVRERAGTNDRVEEEDSEENRDEKIIDDERDRGVVLEADHADLVGLAEVGYTT
jgi:hypothetical protein